MLRTQVGPCPYAFATIIKASLQVYESPGSRNRYRMLIMAEMRPWKMTLRVLSQPLACRFSWAFNNPAWSWSKLSALSIRAGGDQSTGAQPRRRSIHWGTTTAQIIKEHLDCSLSSIGIWCCFVCRFSMPLLFLTWIISRLLGVVVDFFFFFFFSGG